jgi:ankyrin repeat protein
MSNGLTIRGFCDAVRAGDIDGVRAMLASRPDLVHLDVSEDDEHRALHHAVLQRRPEMVRLLMQYGADARKGIWPHRDATNPLTIATERGYADIVAIIREEESRRAPVSANAADAPVTPSSSRHGVLSEAVKSARPDTLTLLLDGGLDPDERVRVDGLEEVVYSWGEPLRQCAILGQPGMAEILLKHGASANTNVYAASSAIYEAHARQDRAMVDLLEGHGGFVDASTAGHLGLTERLHRLFDDEAAGRLPAGLVSPAGTVAEDLLFGAAATGNVDLVQMALEHLDWPRGDARWQGKLMQPLGRHPESERDRFLKCFEMILERSGVGLPYRFGRTLLHDVAGGWPRSAPMGAAERVGFATILLNAGAMLEARDDLLRSTPLGWACRWGRVELVTLLLERGADPVEADAEPWATPLAWAKKMNRDTVRSILTKHARAHVTPHENL